MPKMNDAKARQLRIVQFANTLARSDGGPARNALELHGALNSRGDCRATMIVLHPSAAHDTVASGEGSLPARTIGGALVIDLPVARALRLLLQTDVVIIHGYYLAWAPIVALLARLAGKRTWITPHGSLTAYQQRFSKLKKALFDYSLGALMRKSIDGFALGSLTEQDDLMRKFPASRSFVAGVGTTMSPSDSNNDLNVPRTEHGVRLLSLSRIAPKKRIDLAIDAVRALRERDVAAHLIVAGSGDPDLLARLAEHANESGVADHIQFAGEVAGEAKRRLIESSDVFLAPSDDENFGISVAEALSSGIACVVSANVASGQGLIPPAGVVLQDRRAATIADAIIRLTVISVDARRASARAFARANFSWEEVATRWYVNVQPQPARA